MFDELYLWKTNKENKVNTFQETFFYKHTNRIQRKPSHTNRQTYNMCAFLFICDAELNQTNKK